jgi:hypothetical protein
MTEVMVDLDVRKNILITTVGEKSMQIKKKNVGIKQVYTVILSCFNTGLKLPPMIIFNGSG